MSFSSQQYVKTKVSELYFEQSIVLQKQMNAFTCTFFNINYVLCIAHEMVLEMSRHRCIFGFAVRTITKYIICLSTRIASSIHLHYANMCVLMELLLHSPFMNNLTILRIFNIFQMRRRILTHYYISFSSHLPHFEGLSIL